MASALDLKRLSSADMTIRKPSLHVNVVQISAVRKIQKEIFYTFSSKKSIFKKNSITHEIMFVH
jgi:hypothetical protein